MRKTPSKNQRRSPSRLGTPGRDGSTTPGAADRFIPNRSAMDFDTSHYKLTREVRDFINSMLREICFLGAFFQFHSPDHYPNIEQY